ncbi:MAG: sugar phosphate nucleotidyltransferase [archaeon]
MKGIILAGGTGSRLYPCTKVTNKHLLPVYDKPMIYYPLNTLLEAGIKDILIISGKEHAGDFLKLLGSGKEFNAKFTYELQEDAGGIAQALALGEDFVDNDKFAVILGDNIFEDNIKKDVEEFSNGKEEARIFIKEVPDPERFGVVELNGESVVGIEEKPKNPKTNFIVTGLYMYSSSVFDVIRDLKPSGRGEYEITDVNNKYIKSNSLKATVLKGFWSDAGAFDSMHRAATFMREKRH